MKFRRLTRNNRPALQVIVESDYSNPGLGLDDLVDQIQHWSETNVCGHRIAWDMWGFRNEKELAFFLLKWS